MEGYSDDQDVSSTQGMFTPSPDDFGRYGEWSIDKDFDTCGLKRSFSVMHDDKARKENALDAEWDKKRDVEGKTSIRVCHEPQMLCMYPYFRNYIQQMGPAIP